MSPLMPHVAANGLLQKPENFAVFPRFQLFSYFKNHSDLI